MIDNREFMRAVFRSLSVSIKTANGGSWLEA